MIKPGSVCFLESLKLNGASFILNVLAKRNPDHHLFIFKIPFICSAKLGRTTNLELARGPVCEVYAILYAML